MTSSRNVKRIIIVCCLMYIVVGFFTVLRFSYEDYDGYSNKVLEIKRVLFAIWMIIIPVGIMISVLKNYKRIVVIMMIVREVLFLIEYIIFKEYDTYTQYKGLKLCLNMVIVILLILWIKCRINSQMMLFFMILNEIDTIEGVAKSVVRIVKGEYLALIYVIFLCSLLAVQILPVVYFGRIEKKNK